MYKTIFTFVLLGFASNMVHAQDYQHLTPEAFNKKLKESKDNPNVVLLDVRTPPEVAQGHIDGAINLDVNNSNFTSKLKTLDKEKTYMVYCRSGSRSARAISTMKDLGFTKIINLDGGILGWQDAGLPVKKK